MVCEFHQKRSPGRLDSPCCLQLCFAQLCGEPLGFSRNPAAKKVWGRIFNMQCAADPFRGSVLCLFQSTPLCLLSLAGVG